MLEILEFIFSDVIHFLGSITILLILVYGVINFRLFSITNNTYIDDVEDDEDWDI